MATFKSNQAVGLKPQASVQSTQGGDIQFDYTAKTALVATDVIELGIIPQGFRVKSFTVVNSDPAATGNVNVGYLNEGKAAITSGLVTLAYPYAVSASHLPWQAGDGSGQTIGMVGALGAGKTVCIVASIVRA